MMYVNYFKYKQKVHAFLHTDMLPQWGLDWMDGFYLASEGCLNKFKF